MFGISGREEVRSFIW